MASNPKIVYVLGVPMELISENVVRPLRPGRPASSVVYGEPTKTVRVPISLLPDLMVKIEALKAHVASQRPSADKPFLLLPLSISPNFKSISSNFISFIFHSPYCFSDSCWPNFPSPNFRFLIVWFSFSYSFLPPALFLFQISFQTAITFSFSNPILPILSRFDLLFLIVKL